MPASLTFFPVGNGDMTLVTLDNDQQLLIDINIRKASEDDNDDTPDVISLLREKLDRDSDGRLVLDGFLLSHPDKDHITGLEAHFHLGAPDDWVEDDDKILISEMWSSPIVFRRASKNHTLCPDAKAWDQEARRRVKLFRETGAIGSEGDRIQILGEDEDGKTDDILAIVVSIDNLISSLNCVEANAFEGRLLAPISSDDVDDVDKLDKNHSSVVIRFSIRGDGYADKCRFLSGGDAEVAIWEHLWDKHGDLQSDWLSYDILQAPHHCSWHSLSYDSFSDMGDDAEVNDDARNALSQIRKGAIVVASSQTIDPEEADPPSDRAKQEYISIVEDDENRFKCVSDIWDEDEAPLVYEITSSGVVKGLKAEAKSAAIGLGLGSTGAQARGHG
ncbi:hypothetical protein A8B75_18620 [Sphingomonadales bacterium EhC05]|nr:hypothetical protein A8B75_18620 [Sphingomonadales bacterium EhC05]